MEVRNMPLWLPDLPSPVSLRRLFPHASFVGCGNVIASDVTEDSREAGPKTIFAAIPGTKIDGRQYAADAVRRGSPAVLSAHPLPGIAAPQCIVPDVRAAFSRLCDAVHGYPARQLRISAVTGTNGKTTTAWLIRSILQTAERRCGLLGTIEYHDGQSDSAASLTTPDARTVSKWFRRMVATDCRYAAIELSSHALDQGRLRGTALTAAVVTNVTQDHFDYHSTYDEYIAAKARIIDDVDSAGIVAVNIDNPGSEKIGQLAVEAGRTVVTYSLESAADLHAEVLQQTLDGTRFRLTTVDGDIEINTPLPGRHNVLNCLGAAAACRHMGLDAESIRRGIESIRLVPGRLQRLDYGQPFHTFIDYAHTDDALRSVVDSLNSLSDGRLICVFGAGGDRDQSKRPLLAAAASRSDFAVVTSDNPRTESPQTIIEDILSGFPAGFTQFHIESDRRRAIDFALAEAKPGDCVLIAGKGHEAEQIIGTERLPFDDREVTRELIEARFRPATAESVAVSTW
jgi:UDP-N-acetylmuramoyl-L-alanyl-D-glutamate--2,6-diaminopimelate ligase